MTALDASANALCGVDENGDGAHSALGLRALLDALRDAPGARTSLTALSLWGNELRADGATALAVFLEDDRCAATALDLRDNALGDRGAAALAAALHKNQTLTFCNLRENGVGAAGGRALAAALSASKTLTFVDLANNPDLDGHALDLLSAPETANVASLLPELAPPSERRRVARVVFPPEAKAPLPDDVPFETAEAAGDAAEADAVESTPAKAAEEPAPDPLDAEDAPLTRPESRALVDASLLVEKGPGGPTLDLAHRGLSARDLVRRPRGRNLVGPPRRSLSFGRGHRSNPRANGRR